MGLISKIEDKLAGNSQSKEERKLEKQYAGGQHLPGQSGQSGNVGSSLQHPIGSGSGPTGSAIGAGHGSSMTDRARGEGYSSNQGYPSDKPSMTERARDTVSGGGNSRNQDYTTMDSNANANSKPSMTERAREAVSGSHGQSHHSGGSHGVDQYSSSGQRAAAMAGEERDVERTHRGGVSNQMPPQGFSSGPHSELENRHAIPVAGGEKVGSVGTDSGYGTGSSHATGAMAGAGAGAGAGVAGRDMADRVSHGRDVHESGYGSRQPEMTSSSHQRPIEGARTDAYGGQPGVSSHAAPTGATGMHPGYESSTTRRPVPGTQLGNEPYDAPGQSSMGTGHDGLSRGHDIRDSTSTGSHYSSVPSQAMHGSGHGVPESSVPSQAVHSSGHGVTDSSMPSQATHGSSHGAPQATSAIGQANPAYEAGFREAMTHREAGYKAAMEQMNQGNH